MFLIPRAHSKPFLFLHVSSLCTLKWQLSSLVFEKSVNFFCLSRVLGNYGERLNFPYLAREWVYLKTQEPMLFLSLQSIWPHI